MKDKAKKIIREFAEEIIYDLKQEGYKFKNITHEDIASMDNLGEEIMFQLIEEIDFNVDDMNHDKRFCKYSKELYKQIVELS